MTQPDAVYDAPPVYFEADAEGYGGERVIYRASSLGACLQMLARCRAGQTPAPPPDLMLERYQEGHDHEYNVKVAGYGVDWVDVTMPDHLMQYGHVVEADNGVLQVECELTWGGEGTAVKSVRCHPDGIAVHRSSLSRSVVEVKFLGDDMMDATVKGLRADGLAGLPNFYRWQTSIEMLATGLPLLLVLGRKRVREVKGERVVDLAPDGVECFEYDMPHYTLVDVKARVAQVEGAARRAEDGGGWPKCPVPFDYPCGFFAEHDEVAVDVIEDDDLKDLVLAWSMERTTAEGHTKKAEVIKEDIRLRMQEIGRASGVVGGFNITVTEDRPGNVSWSRAYKALAKVTGERVDEDEFRGDEVAGGVTMRKVKD
jgi:hypothetical protein